MFGLNNVELILIALWFLAICIQLFYYLYFYSRLSTVTNHTTNQFPPVSVIVCARNEAENLQQYLPSILNQDYPNYEVIVVNDASEDESDIILKNMQEQYQHLKISTIKKDEKFNHNKKLALTIGIKAASNEILLLTNADCYAADNQWIKSMVSSYKPETEIVLGYGGYCKIKGLLNKLIRFDTLTIAMQYFSFAKAGIPYMGVGRNLSYKKSLFFRNKGFARHSYLSSGDDDLFVNETATKKNVSINVSTHTRSVPKKTFWSWIMQKKRHQSTFHKYRLKHKLLLIFEPISRWLFYILFAVLLFLLPEYWAYLLIAFTIRWIVLGIAYYFSTKTLKEKDLLLFSPIFDVVMLFVDVIVKIGKNPYRKSTWK